MSNEHERTLRMKGEYSNLHMQGYGPQDIAKKFNLSPCTVYSHLQEIADANGVSRESLLVSPHISHAPRGKPYNPIKPLDIDDLILSTEKTIEEATKLSKSIEKYLDEQEEGEEI